MKTPFSKFVRAFEYNDSVVLFNSYNKSIVTIENRYFDNGELNDSFPDEYRDALDQMGYFITDDQANELIQRSLVKDKKLMLSAEVSLACNLRCPYCYQGNDKTSCSLSGDSIDNLVRYCGLVDKENAYDEIVLKVLGGEPTVTWEKTKAVIDSISSFCRSNGKKLNLMLDTNGVLIDNILSLEGYDSLLLTVPLTYKDCHDSMRKLANGQGTYDIIVENINKIHEAKPQTLVVLRHNTDDKNIRFFDYYVKDLRSRLSYNPIIDISYTTELGNGTFVNGLSYKDYIDWKSGKAIDILVANDCNVAITPLMSTDRCQHRSAFSMKLFSDGTIGSCAMWFFKKDRISLEDLCNDISKIQNVKNHDPEEYAKCSTCRSFFLCGGGYNLPCIKSLGFDQCREDGNYIVDIEMFIKKYVEYKKQGKSSLFVGFNNKMVIR